jgi:hypothetical protein
MNDVRLIEVASRQHRCIATRQLHALGYGDAAIAHRVDGGRLVRLHDAVFAVAPVLDDQWTRWMAATLTAPGSVLSHASAGGAWGFWDAARAVREACRLHRTSPSVLLLAVAGHRGRRGTGTLRHAVSRYTGLPLHRARSDAEALALALIHEGGRPVPQLNVRVAGEEADLVWVAHRLIVALDGPQFHLDATEDLRKQQGWEAAGWTVLRLPTDDVYLRPERLLAVAPLAERR